MPAHASSRTSCRPTRQPRRSAGSPADVWAAPVDADAAGEAGVELDAAQLALLEDVRDRFAAVVDSHPGTRREDKAGSFRTRPDTRKPRWPP